MAAGEGVIAELFSAVSLVPDVADLDARQASIERLAEDLSEETWAKIEAHARARSEEGDVDVIETVGHFRSMFAAKAFGPDELPPSILARVRTRDGGWALFAYSSVDRADMEGGLRVMAETRDYSLAGEPFVGEGTIYASLYEVLTTDAAEVLGFTLVVILGLIALQLSSVGWALVAASPLALGLWLMFSGLGLGARPLTLFSFPVLPAVLGIGVDHGVYLVTTLRRADSEGRECLAAASDTIRAIVAAGATTFVGFASFLIADNGGLRSIGYTAGAGVITTAAAAIFVVPTVHGVRSRLRSRFHLGRGNKASDAGKYGVDDEA